MDKTTTVHPRVTWEALCADPALRDLNYKVETNEYGQLIMSPLNPRHGRRQMKIGQLFARLLRGGESAVETPVWTPDHGTKAADVTWAPRAFWQRHDGEPELLEAPSICVEVLSPTNTKGEITGKRELYFERGAREVWVCDLEGRMTFYGPAGALERSVICPKFPAQVKI